ncbi:hypothetical protein [Streptomyces sp. NPDC087270]|uniref:hypothetical protein n=1 Tax=Streptomyces sp. NPDC087270 TaxID=3365774 RepID=UPI003820D0B1
MSSSHRPPVLPSPALHGTVRGAVLALLAGLSTLCGLFVAAAPAGAAQAPARTQAQSQAQARSQVHAPVRLGAPATGGTAGQRIADALKASPVYVDPAYAGAVPPARQKQLVARIGRTHLPIKVALVPLVKGDAFDGDSTVLQGVLHDRLGMGNLILITMDGEFGDTLTGQEWPDDTHQVMDAASAVGLMDDMKSAGLADRVAKAIDLIASGDGKKAYDQATADIGGPPTTAKAEHGKGGSAGSGPGAVVWLLVVAAVVVLGGGAGWLLRRRSMARRASPFAFPREVFAAEEVADESALRRRAEAEVIALGEAVEDADAGSRPGLARALDAYAAAGKVLDGARGIPDLAGVLALVAEGRDAFDGRFDALPLCFFDPLHGRAARRLVWRPLGSRDTLRVAACAECATAVEQHRAPEVLTDTATDGRRVPYFEVPAGESVWAATGYGSLVPPPAPVAQAAADAADAGAGDRSVDRDTGPGGIAPRVLDGDFPRPRRPR